MKMSGLNGSGEMSLGNFKVEIAESNIATLFAQDIVNEVLQKAFTIASKLTWDCIEENKSCRNLIGEYVNSLEETHFIEMETEKSSANNVASLPCKDLPSGRGGVGDQPIVPRQNSATEVFDQPAPQECTATPIEKKSRVADLVKSSKQILSAYIMDDKTKRIRDKLEEEQEQFLQVIELDANEVSKAQFKAYRKVEPETIPLPDDDDVETEEEFLQIPVSDAMDTVELNAEPVELVLNNEKENENNEATVPPLEVTSEDVRDGPSESNQDDSNSKEKKKKWNLGAKIMQFLSRPKQKARGTQTITRK